ncbi:MAG: TonB-dependent receptor, partial [Calditrichaeota bacterium]
MRPFFQCTMAGCLALFWLGTSALAQGTGSISGRVLNAETGAGLAKVNIVLLPTTRGASSASDGAFALNNIPPGSYTLHVSHIGFAAFRQEITIAAGRSVDLKIRLHPAATQVPEIFVQAERAYSAASSRLIRQWDLRLRPHRSAQDMLRLAPGLFIAQHAGGGKAEQIFLRGFDADHGTDVAIFTDGMPVNMVSHGHGQGYADLHFLIPEIVES